MRGLWKSASNVVWAAGIVSVSLTGCGPSGFGAEAESWNSYYYGTSSSYNQASYEPRDSDSDYQLPKKYQTFEGARDARIVSENIIHPN